MSQQVFSNQTKRYPLGYADGSMSMVAKVYDAPSIPNHDANSVAPVTTSLVGKVQLYSQKIMIDFSLVDDATGLRAGSFTPGANALMSFVLGPVGSFPFGTTHNQTFWPTLAIPYRDDQGAKTGCARLGIAGDNLVLEIHPSTDVTSVWSTLRSTVVLEPFMYSYLVTVL